MSFSQKIIFFLILPVLGVFFCSEFSQAAYQSPSANPVSGNDVYSYIYNDLGGSNDIYIFDKLFGVGGDFSVNNEDLFVEVDSSRVGVGTNSPAVTLDVNGVLRVGQGTILPTCINGTFFFYLSEDRLFFCYNGWHRIGYDGDMDGWLDSHDCNDSDPNINPGVDEVCGDTIDDNCDGSLTTGCSNCEIDEDNDNYGSGIYDWQITGDCPTYSGDCDDEDPNINPGVAEICNNMIDENCDTSYINGCNTCYYDNDDDEYGISSTYLYLNDCEDLSNYAILDGDCDDNNPSINPGSEICGDAVTNDCDSLVNEGCICTASEWTSLSCPNMSNCDNHVDLTATKLTDCNGSAPTLHCECVCRFEHFYAPVPPTCPVCVAYNTTIYSTKVSGVTCIDSNSISDTYCADNCGGYCSGDTCCDQSTYYSCSGSYRVYHDACGNTSSTYCTYGCSGGSCQSDPCVYPTTPSTCSACGGSWVANPNGGGYCISVH